MQKSLKNTKYFLRYYWKRILIIFIAIIVLCSFGTGFSISRNNALFKLICTMIDDIVSTDTLQEVESFVTVGYNKTSVTLGGYTINKMGTVMLSVNDAMKVFSIVFTATLFFVGLMNAFMAQQAYAEVLIKRFIVLGVTIGVIAWSLTLCLDIANLGSGIASKIAKIAETTFEEQDDLIASLKDSILEDCSTADGKSWWKSITASITDVLSAIGYVLEMFIPWVCMKAVGIIVKITCWGRAFELIILATLSPLAFCDISSGNGAGMSSMGRFIKNFAAIAIQGAIILLIMFFSSQVHLEIIRHSTESNAFLSHMWDIVVIGFVEVGLCTKSQGIARQLIGAA